MSLLNPPIRVVLADDHEMVRDALAKILEQSGKINVVKQASDGQQAIAAAEECQPEVLVLDYSLPQGDGPEVIQTLQQSAPEVRILVLTVHENVHYAVRVLELGAHGYLIKSAAVNELVEAISTVREGRVYISQKVSDEVLQHLRRPKRERVGIESLSQREFSFLRLLGAGRSLQESAKEMDISASTASTYRARIMEKLSLSSTADLIRYAIEHDIVR